MNIDFAAEPGFSAYVLLLMFSGLVMVFVATPLVKQEKLWLRVLNAVIGFGFFGYGFYLAFLFQGGSYFIFFKAFFVPVALVVRTVQANRAAKAQAAAVAQQQQWPAAPPQQQWNPPQQQQWGQPPQQWPAPQPGTWDRPQG